MKAMVLAAGLGSRLRPLTNSKPKALVEVGGVPLLEIVIRRMVRAGVDAVIVNVHHLPQQIEAFLKKKNNFGIRIDLSREDALLETGGGLKKAAAFFDDGEPFFLYNADFWLWHAPPLYNATLENQSIHILEHLTFIVFGVITWWPIFSPLEEGLPRLSFGGQILYLFFSGMPSVALGAGLTFSSPLYAPYLAAPRIWGISAATDQQLGGLIMWIPGGILYIVIMSALFIRWMQKQEAKQLQKEAEEYKDVIV